MMMMMMIMKATVRNERCIDLNLNVFDLNQIGLVTEVAILIGLVTVFSGFAWGVLVTDVCNLTEVWIVTYVSGLDEIGLFG